MDASRVEAGFVISASKPSGTPARMLESRGIAVVPIEQDEGNIDRYVISPRVAVERRTGLSLLQGIMDKTLFTSAIYLREHFEVPILILEGTVDREYSGFDPRAVRGAVTAMPLAYGLSVLSTEDTMDTVETLAMITRQEQGGIPEISFVPKRKAVDLPDLQRRVVEMLPGCGMVMARTILRRFGSVGRLLRATEEELLAVKGVGRKTARGILDVLATPYLSLDTEQDLEDALEADPSLLLGRPLRVIARQHYILSDTDGRHFVDLLMLDEERAELLFVELKRGRIMPAHEDQLQRYLDHASDSATAAPFLAAGAAPVGILASTEESWHTPRNEAIRVVRVDREAAIRVLSAHRPPPA